MTAFHSAFARALFAPEGGPADPALGGLASQPAFAVYRNTVMKGCIDALEANFPAVARLVGTEWFRSAAAEYVRAHPPTDACLVTYGDDGFDAFLEALPTTAHVPYLAGVAQLDTLWRQSHAAADAPVLPAGALARDAPDALAARVLRVHPATRWTWHPALPVAAIWLRTRSGQDAGEALEWCGGGLLLTRPGGEVLAQPLDAGGCFFLARCRDGLPLGDVAQATLDDHPDADLAGILQALLQAGAFAIPPQTGESP